MFDKVGLRMSKAMDQRANGKRGEMGQQTEENDGKIGVRHG